LIENKDDLECPECRGYVIPKTLGFYLCEYIVNGEKIDGKKPKSFQFTGKAESQDSIQYYIPEENGETLIIELIIEITKYL
jgi:hypothetical protein